MSKNRLQEWFEKCKQNELIFEDNPIFWEYIFEFLIRGDFGHIIDLF